MDILFRVACKIATKKDIDTKASRNRVINQTMNIPKTPSWYEEHIEKLNTIVKPIPKDYGVPVNLVSDGITTVEDHQFELPAENISDNIYKRKQAIVNDKGIIEYVEV